MSRKNRKNMENTIMGVNPVGAPVTIRINHLDIHMDERMYSKNSFTSDEEEAEKPVTLGKVPVDDIFEQIAKKCNVSADVVKAVVEAHQQVLEEVCMKLLADAVQEEEHSCHHDCAGCGHCDQKESEDENGKEND